MDGGKIMHSPSSVNCMYSSESIQKGEIAVTFTSEFSNGSNEWLKLTNVNPLIQELIEVYENPDQYEEGDSFGDREKIMFSSKRARRSCIQCGEYDGRKEKIISFAYISNHPYIHVDCLDEFIDSLRNIDQKAPTDILVSEII